MNNSSKTSGFTLPELAIVLVIIAFLISMIISTGATRIEAQRINLTKERMNFIMAAIVQYSKTFSHLPCPADPTDDLTDANLGIGLGSGEENGVSGQGNCTAFSAKPATGNLVIGMVPLETLGLSTNVGSDAWGGRFTYVVDENLVFAGEADDTDDLNGPRGFLNDGPEWEAEPGGGDPPTVPKLYPANYGELGNIVVQTVAGNGFTPSPPDPQIIEENAAILIISHGSNGYGAYREKTGARNGTAGIPANEAENTDDDERFVLQFPSDAFDDFMLYKTKGQLVQ